MSHKNIGNFAIRWLPSNFVCVRYDEALSHELYFKAILDSQIGAEYNVFFSKALKAVIYGIFEKYV